MITLMAATAAAIASAVNAAQSAKRNQTPILPTEYAIGPHVVCTYCTRTFDGGKNEFRCPSCGANHLEAKPPVKGGGK